MQVIPALRGLDDGFNCKHCAQELFRASSILQHTKGRDPEPPVDFSWMFPPQEEDDGDVEFDNHVPLATGGGGSGSDEDQPPPPLTSTGSSVSGGGGGMSLSPMSSPVGSPSHSDKLRSVLGSGVGAASSSTPVTVSGVPEATVSRLRSDSNDTSMTAVSVGKMSPRLSPILGVDVWEHSYYIDYRNVRATYVENFWKLVNWDFVATNFAE